MKTTIATLGMPRVPSGMLSRAVVTIPQIHTHMAMNISGTAIMRAVRLTPTLMTELMRPVARAYPRRPRSATRKAPTMT